MGLNLGLFRLEYPLRPEGRAMFVPPEHVSETEMRQAIHRLSHLVEVSVTLNSTLELEPLLYYIIETAASLLDCEAASILLYDEKRGDLNFTAASGPDPKKLSQISVPLESSIAGAIFSQNQPLVINDVEKDPRHYGQVGEQINFRPRSLLGVPMRIRERTTGVIEALNKRQGEFNEADVSLLSVIASQAAVAIHNANLLKALQDAYNELSRVDKVKSDFIAIASHELRTPLGVILGYASFLQEETHGDISDHATRVLNSALRLRTLVEAMTNLNLLQLGSLTLHKQPVNLQSVIRSACEEIAPTLEAKGHRLTLDLPAEPLLVQADAEKLGLVFLNLLNNAVRFTPDKGEIQLAARREWSEIVVIVSDNGIGIPSTELENIFKEFYQVEDHMTRRYGGMGLGLTIARGLVSLHSGRIWAESEGPNRGAAFLVTLPAI